MKKYIAIAFISGAFFTSCGEYSKVFKSTDYLYKYEAAKSYFGKGQYNKASTILEELITILKGTEDAQESLYMLAMSYYNQGDYITASHYFTSYYNTYPNGTYTELARFHSGKALFLDTPEPRLDQSSTFSAISELQMFMEYFPASKRKTEAQLMIFGLQDKLVEKEYLNAKMYYDLGTYFGNCTNGGNNFQACIVTAQNAISDYPYSSRRENFAILILKAKFELAAQSVLDKQEERYHNAIDEYYGFCNEYPESSFMPQAKELYEKAKRYVKN